MNRFQENMKKLRENPETNRAGLKWDSDEDDKMIEKLKADVSIDDIAKELRRTPGSIKTRIIMNAIIKIDDEDADINSVLKEYKITENDIQEYREKKQQREEKLNSPHLYNNKSARYVSNPSNKDIYNAILENKTLMLEMKNMLLRKESA